MSETRRQDEPGTIEDQIEPGAVHLLRLNSREPHSSHHLLGEYQQFCLTCDCSQAISALSLQKSMVVTGDVPFTTAEPLFRPQPANMLLIEKKLKNYCCREFFHAFLV